MSDFTTATSALGQQVRVPTHWLTDPNLGKLYARVAEPTHELQEPPAEPTSKKKEK